MSTKFYFYLACLLMVFAPAWCLAEQTGPSLTRARNAPVVAPPANSVHFVDVTRADGVFVKDPIIASDAYSEEIANQNSVRMQAILSSPAIGEYCRIHFPAGSYYFNGAAPGWDASIQSTAKNQSITGDGINATRIIQKSTTASATIKVSHSNCTVQNLSIMSADYQPKFNRDWDEDPHQTAILLETLKTNPPWHTDPQILNVNINATGNNIASDGFYRPFKTGIKFLGPWLNVYVHSMFILHVHNAIYVNQGSIIAGPAKFIDVNAYAPAPTDIPQTWNTFFKSEGHFMEQVELIHCSYIGSQFIYMDGSKPSPGINPVFNMVIDHCYINSLWLPLPSEDPKWSGIYLNLPPKGGAVDPGYGQQFISKSLVFTYNFCAGKSPRDGAFLYVEGNVNGLRVIGNEFASGGADRCIYVRATTPLTNSDIAVKEIAISDNIFNDYKHPITIGGNHHDPSRLGGVAYVGTHDDLYYIQDVTITGNRTYYLPVLEGGQVAGMFLNRVRGATISGNSFSKLKAAGVILRECQDITINGNRFSGMTSNQMNGIYLLNSTNATLTGNLLRGFATGIQLRECEGLALNGNNLIHCTTALLLTNTLGITVSANTISESEASFALHGLQDVSVLGNMIIRSGPRVVSGENKRLELQDESSSMKETIAVAKQKGDQSLLPGIQALMEERGVFRNERHGRDYFTSYFSDLYDWELYYDTIALAYVGGERYAVNGLKIFLAEQQPDGFICRRITRIPPIESDKSFTGESKEHCKPFLFQTALIIGRTRGNLDWLTAQDYRGLKRYLNYWLTTMDRDSNGLSEWVSAPHSGADTQLDRIGPWESYYCEGVDLNCFLYKELLAAAYLAKDMGFAEDATFFQKQAEKKRERIQSLLWDDRDSYYYSRDRRTGNKIKIKSAETFLPLWAGVATPDQASLLVNLHLKNPAEFWTPYPVPSYALTEPQYTQSFKTNANLPACLGVQNNHANWCGGMWPHWNYMMIHGLVDYGFVEEAKHMTQKLCEAASAKEGLYEWYNAETGKGHGLNPFWGGATIVGILLPAELDLGFKPSKPRSILEKLDFKPIRDVLQVDGIFSPKVVH